MATSAAIHRSGGQLHLYGAMVNVLNESRHSLPSHEKILNRRMTMNNETKKIPPHLSNQVDNGPNFSPYPHGNSVAPVNPFDDGLAGLYPVPQVTQRTESRRVETSSVIDSCLKELRHTNSKESTKKTYGKSWARFEAQFDYLPTERDVILQYLERYDGKTGRYRRNNQDHIHLLYKHALLREWITSDPMQGLKRPRVLEQEPNPLSLEQVKILMNMEFPPRELAVLHILVGHGWRQNEVLEIKARDVRSISGGMILCHGKQREERTPILPETADLWRGLAEGLDDDAQVIQGKRGRDERFGSTGMSNLVNSVFARAGLTGFTGHNLRDTFATLVTEQSDSITAMKLMRDKVPGVAPLYIKWDLPTLLERCSPLRQLGGTPPPKSGLWADGESNSLEGSSTLLHPPHQD
jgi:integrase